MSPKRPLFSGAVLHVVQRGVNRMPVFRDEEDFGFYRDSLLDAVRRYDTMVHAYALMTNHVHLLMTSCQENSVARTMQSVGSRYVRHFNARHDRSGTLWECKYRSALVDSDRYLLACMRYVEMNPVRAGLVQDPGQYAWSSYRANRSGMRDPLVTAHSVYEALGQPGPQRYSAYASLFKSDDADEIRAIRTATQRATSLSDAGGTRELLAKAASRNTGTSEVPRR